MQIKSPPMTDKDYVHMQIKTPPMTRQHYEFIADIVGPQVAWPSHLHSIADALESTNVRFNRAKFIERATKAWEDNYEPKEIDDEIIY